MTEEILINVTPQETRVAVTGSGVVQELLIERAASRGLVGNIYMGRVARVLPGMQSAFLEIGLERAAFLHVADIWEHRKAITGEPQKPIEKILAEGEPLLVQVVKDPIGSKGARLSTQISIAGRLLVYLPYDPHIGISQRIEDEGGRQALRDRLKDLVPADEKGGFIVRTLGETATEEELRADLQYLRHLWQVIRNRSVESQGGASPQLLYQDLSLAQRVLRDMVSVPTSRVLVDSREHFQKLAAFAQNYMPQVRTKLEHYIGERPLFDLYNVETEIEKALVAPGRPQVRRLPDHRPDRGDDHHRRQHRRLRRQPQLRRHHLQDQPRGGAGDRAPAAAAQPRRHHHRRLHRHGKPRSTARRCSRNSKRALARDRTRMSVNGFTALGLVEMTRKRTRESLAHVLCEPCPTCDGRGEVKTAHTVCYEILREILREARAVQRTRVPRARLAAGDRPVPRGGVGLGGDAVRLHRQADLDAGRIELHPGAVRHRPDVEAS